jgi:spermidine synthase
VTPAKIEQGAPESSMPDVRGNSSSGRSSSDPSSSGLAFTVLHALAIFLSAFLLFQVEPLIAQVILPWFGGVAAVWTVCLLFFQAVLLLGYLYAHLLTRSVSRQAQGWLHSAILAASLLTLPIFPKDSWKLIAPGHPAAHILLVLALTVGLPFFLLSSTTPLLQSWFANTSEDPGVYRFYALSNAASLAALLSYPIFFEPRLSTLQQARNWSVAYTVAAAMCGTIALSQRSAVSHDRARPGNSGPGWRTQALWVALSACSSALLLSITNHVSQNIAAVPLLWVIPLSLYLLSLILCFEGPRWYRRTFFLRLLGVAVGGMAYALSPSLAVLPFWLSIVLFYAGLSICCMFCHGELALCKPLPSHLTSFYFLCSLGSLAGAAFVALVAPQTFSGFYELHVSLGVCALLVILVHRNDPASPFRESGARPAWLILHLLAAVVIVSLLFTAREQSAGATLMVRNFYGALRVTNEIAPHVMVLKGNAQPLSNDDFRFRRLTNGTVCHGLEFVSPSRRDQPTSYYSVNSGIGVTLRAMTNRGPLHVGVIGLGVGTIAAYGQAGDAYTFYEINPLVVRIARNDFRFLKDSKAGITIELGDARLTLERQAPQNFDVLAVDAFSSDAIPVHLLTLEAFELYFRHLKPEGLLAVHISNQHLNLEPVVGAAAARLGKEAVVINSNDDRENGIVSATWVILGNRNVFTDLPAIEKAGRLVAAQGLKHLWTDSHSSLFSALK